MATFLQQLAGKTGRAIDIIGRSVPQPIKQAISPNLRPDFGISERLESYGGQRLPSVMGAQAPAPSPSPSFNPIIPSGGGGYRPSGGITGGNVPAGNPGLQNDINRQTDDFASMIENDFNTAMGALNAQEESLRREGEGAISSSQAEAGQARTELQNTQATNISGLTGQEQTVRKQESSGLQQARDLFRQIQQQNIAKLSGLGISSSSVAEALAERLGVETARRIAGVSGSANEVINNIAAEKTRVNTYFQQKMSDLEASLKASTDNIRASLLDGISQINQARNQAASDKANQRTQLFSNAQSALANLQANAQNFQQQLQQWQASKSSALDSAKNFAFNPTDFSGLNNQLGLISSLQNAGLGGQRLPAAIAGGIGSENLGLFGQGPVYTIPRRQTQEDELVNPFAI